jgi:hypothetical protein
MFIWRKTIKNRGHVKKKYQKNKNTPEKNGGDIKKVCFWN